MPVSRLKFEALPHAIFLQRITAQSSAPSLEARLGQGAFLALRLVDLLASDREPVSRDAFHYQCVATDRFCRELRAAATEGAHVHGIATSAADAQRLGDVRLLVPALLAYAHFLEDGLRLEEALDVLWTLVRVGGERLPSPDGVAARLRIARVHRKLNRFDEAEAAYTEAGEMAAAAGDRYSELLSRIGRANTVLGRGNLAEAERSLRGILADARAAGERDAEARAEHGVGVALHHMGQPAEAIPHVWRAFELYGDEDSRLRALGDLGVMLLMVGNPDAAEQALSGVVRRCAAPEVVSNALIELMHCASYRGDRVGFARWRERCEARVADMPPNICADFYLKQGIGQARFGQFRRAEALMAKALEIASASGLHEFEFRIERIKRGLRDCEQLLQLEPSAPAEPVFDSVELREVSASLAHLVQ
ncbi:MAG TPA: tetratricopeptide repeat protein [Gemmatimonadales bacterium]|nr:tetratricopeptide repeat protein [Gemmatimonadales bacterium]